MLVIRVSECKKFRRLFLSTRIHVCLGKFNATDLVYYFRKLGIKIDLDEADRLVEK